MQISTKTLMHTIKHIRFLCHYAKRTCSDDKKTLTWVDSFTSVPNSFKLAVFVHI